MADNLHFIQSEDLAPLFWPPSRFGVESAWYAHIPFAHWLVSNIRPRILVELGTHNGVSYSAFCEAVERLRLPTSCFAVDTWLGDEHAGRYGEEVYEDMVRFNSVRYASFSELLRCTFDEALPYFADNSIDLLHIDGLHTYEAGKHDFEFWLPKLSDRAVVLFHDTNVRERSFGIWRLFIELKQRYPTFEFLHGHGLGVVAVGTDVPAAVAALCALNEHSINSIRERFSMMGEHWAYKAPGESSVQRRLDKHAQTIEALEAALQETRSRSDSFEAQLREARSHCDAFEAELREVRSHSDTSDAALQEAHSRSEAFEVELQKIRSRSDSLEAQLQQMRSCSDSFETQLLEAHSRSCAFEAGLKDEHARADCLAAEIGSLRTELLDTTNAFGPGLRRYLRRIVSWHNYDSAYQVWKEYNKKLIHRHEALEMIDDKYGVRPFFLLYPLYKTVKPFVKISRKILGRASRGNLEKAWHTAPVGFDADWYLKRYPDIAACGMDPLQHFIEYGRAEGRLGCAPQIKVYTRSTFDSSKRTMLLVSHDASQTGAPIIAFNLLEKFAARYNVVSVLLGPGRLEEAFRNVSPVTIGPFDAQTRNTPLIHQPILDACRKFAPAFAIVNSIESREALIPLAEAGVPSVLLVHEFASAVYGPADFMKAVKYAGQVVFPARVVLEDAVAAFPWLPLTTRPANIITQGPCRLPREWMGKQGADDEQGRIAAVMRPPGAEDDDVVVMGCGIVDVRKGVDLFISVAAALQQRSPLRRYRFVWVGKGNPSEDLRYSSYLDEQINRSGLKDIVKFLGEVNCVGPTYAMADIFLLSSRLDPLPNAAIDAMFAALPVVCFNNASGVAEMLSKHVDLKRLVVPYADASSAAEVIDKLSDDDSYRQATKVAIRDLALSTFDMDRYVERIEQTAQTAAIIKRQEDDDFATINRSDALIMEYAAPPGFAEPRDAYIRRFIRETAVGNLRYPFPGFHPGIYRNAHPGLSEPPFVNPLAHFIRSGQPKGPWLLDIIRPEHSPSAKGHAQRVALHLHIHYPDLTLELLRPIKANGTRPDIFVTVSSEEARREVAEKAAEVGVNIEEITVVPNRGRDVGPLLTLLGRRMIEDYDIVGHLHSKRAPHIPDSRVGATWRTFCLENLLGGKHAMMDVILDRFSHNVKLGLAFPCDPYIVGWTSNRPYANSLMKRMGILTELPDEFFFPVGTMFWARTDAIAPLLQIDLTWSDYPIEPLPIDGTILHAIERLFPVVAQYRGFQIAGTCVPGVIRSEFPDGN